GRPAGPASPVHRRDDGGEPADRGRSAPCRPAARRARHSRAGGPGVGAVPGAAGDTRAGHQARPVGGRERGGGTAAADRTGPGGDSPAAPGTGFLGLIRAGPAGGPPGGGRRGSGSGDREPGRRERCMKTGTCPRRRDEIVQRRAVTAALAAAVLLLTAGCSSDDGGSAGRGSDSASPGNTAAQSPSATGTDARTPPAKGSVKVLRTVTTGLSTPWGLAPLDDGDLLVSSRDDATITRVAADTGKKTELGEVPGVSPAGEGGLLGIALSPEYASDHMIYAYFTSASDNRVVRMVYNEKKPAGQQLGAPDTVLRGIPKGVIHNGGRISFGPDGMLYVGTGERGDTGLSQDKESLGGKIL